MSLIDWRVAAYPIAFSLAANPAVGQRPIQEPPPWRQTALHVAVAPTHQRSAKSVALILAFGAEVNVRDNNGATPLKALIPCRNPEIGEEELRIVDALANAGADLNLPDNMGATPLTCAVQTAHFAATARLIALGVELNPVLPGGENYVHMAARLKMEKSEAQHILQALIVAGVDFDNADERGRTPLHAAVFAGNAGAVQVLLHHGADRHRKDSAGHRPADLVACPTEGGCSPQIREMAAMLSTSTPVLQQSIQVGEISALTGTEVEISGASVRRLRVGERLFVRSTSGDYSILVGQLVRDRRKAKISPAAARRVALKDRVYRKETVRASPHRRRL